MKVTIRRGSWIVTIPLVGAALAYLLLFFLPGRRAVGELKEQIETKREYIKKSAGLAKALLAVQQQLGKAEAYNTRWLEHAPARRDLAALYGRINQLAWSSGTVVTRFDPERIRARAKLQEIPLSMGCMGSFRQIYEFLRSLETLPQEIWVKELSLEKRDTPKGFVTCELSLAVFADNPEDSDYVKHSE